MLASPAGPAPPPTDDRHARPALPPTDEPLVSTKDAAAWLGLAVDTLKKLAQRGEIASIKLGKVRRFEKAVLRAYIAEHRVQQAG
jgi:excisionase family DNA binding protein